MLFLFISIKSFEIVTNCVKINLLTVGKRYVVKLHWASYVDILLPPTWATFEMENFYTVDEYREIKLNDLGIWVSLREEKFKKLGI